MMGKKYFIKKSDHKGVKVVTRLLYIYELTWDLSSSALAGSCGGSSGRWSLHSGLKC